MPEVRQPGIADIGAWQWIASRQIVGVKLGPNSDRTRRIRDGCTFPYHSTRIFHLRKVKREGTDLNVGIRSVPTRKCWNCVCSASILAGCRAGDSPCRPASGTAAGQLPGTAALLCGFGTFTNERNGRYGTPAMAVSTVSTSAPISRPSVPAFLYGLVESRW